MEKKEEFVILYEYIQSKLLNNPLFRLRPSKRNDLLIDNFMKSIDFDLWNYLVFQFAFKNSSYSRFKVLPIIHIIGNNALKRWKQRTSNQQFMVDKFVYTLKLVNPLKSSNNCLSEDYLDKQRKKYFSSSRGFIHCMSYGSLYDEKKCLECSYNYICREL